MTMQPPRLETLGMWHARAHLLATIRRFFVDRGFVEVDTPVAIRAPAPEAAIEAVPVTMATHFDQSLQVSRFLQTSPELAMKRLVAAGLPQIFQIACVFRDGDNSGHHRPEFRLLEWYRAHAPYQALMADCEALVTACCEALRAHLRADVLATLAPRLDALRPPYRRLTVDACFRRFAGFSLFEALTPDSLRAAMAAQEIGHGPNEDWDDLFARVMVDRVEPGLMALGVPVFVSEFPAAQAALAQLCPHDARVAERFELYAFGLELANAFGELTDATQQRQRFADTRAKRRAQGRRDYPLDEAFLGALEAMPPTSGIALGIERLLMVLLGQTDIDAVSFLPWHDA